MSRFKRLSHVIWHCQYHIVWVPKYRFRILKSQVAEEVGVPGPNLSALFGVTESIRP